MQRPSTRHTLCLLAGAWLTSLCAAGQLDAAKLTIKVIEKNTARTLPCRIHLKNPAGKPVQAGKLPFWRDHFVCPGSVVLELETGDHAYEVERGPEYRRAAGVFTIKNDDQTATIELERL
ncbi:MAG: hypothetical protein AB7K24_11735, partial [Gemmataceae bacterium]